MNVVDRLRRQGLPAARAARRVAAQPRPRRPGERRRAVGRGGERRPSGSASRPTHVIDYLALVGDSSDNVPGVKGIGDKTARELVAEFGDLEAILAQRRRDHEEAAARGAARARRTARGCRRSSSRFATICRLALTSTTCACASRTRRAAPALRRARVPHARAIDRRRRSQHAPPRHSVRRADCGDYPSDDALRHRRHRRALERIVARARKAPYIAHRHRDGDRSRQPTEESIRCARSLVAISIARRRRARRTTCRSRIACLAAGAGRAARSGDHDRRDRATRPDSDADEASEAKPRQPRAKRAKREESHRTARASRRARSPQARQPVRNLPPLDEPAMAPLRALLEDAAVAEDRRRTRSTTCSRCGARASRCAGSISDTMLASYVLDPGRRSHGLDLLALEFLDHTMTTYEDLCGKGKAATPVRRRADRVRARLLVRGRGHDAAAASSAFEPQLEAQQIHELYRDVEMPLVGVLADMEWAGIAIDVAWFASLKERFARERERVEQEIYAAAGGEFNINSNPQLREILFERARAPGAQEDGDRPVHRRERAAGARRGRARASRAPHGVPRALQAREHVPRRAARARATRRRARCTRRSTRPSRRRAGSPRAIRTCRTFPIRRELGRDIRRGFVPRKGWLFLAADYSQIELRLLAHLSDDPAFVARVQRRAATSTGRRRRSSSTCRSSR